MNTRLNRTSVLPNGVIEPVRPTSAGIVHLGVGAFHRAHQAVYTQDAMRASGDTSWGIVGVAQRSRRIVDELRPQGGVFSVLTVQAGSTLDVVGSIIDVLAPGEDMPAVLAAFAAPEAHVVTITVTESGYPTDEAGGLRVADVAQDLEILAAEFAGEPLGTRASSSMIGMLSRGLAARFRAGGHPLTIISCDNLRGNGRLLERLVTDAVRLCGGSSSTALLEWIADRVTFPDSMVDRIVPAPTPELRDEVEGLLGARDEAAVGTEAFRQWVIQDRFAGPRPPWELAGVSFVDEVGPFEDLKLRLLNGTHSVLAYAGGLRGCRTIDEAIADPVVAAAAERYLFGDAVPNTVPPSGVDVSGYARMLMARFASAALGHTVAKVAMDATLKIPLRWAPVADAVLRAGGTPHGVAGAYVRWALFLRHRPELIVDPRASELRAHVAASGTDEELLSRLLRESVAMPAAISRHPRFREAAFVALDETVGEGWR